MNTRYLIHLKNAKESLKIWLSNAEQMHFGNTMFVDSMETDRLKTDFANWYFGEGQTFSSFEAFKVLESFYDETFDKFLEYISLSDKPVKKSLFSSGKDKREEELNEIFHDFKQNSRKLIKSVEIFEQKLLDSPLFEGVDTSDVTSDTNTSRAQNEAFELIDDFTDNSLEDIEESNKVVENLYDEMSLENFKSKDETTPIQPGLKNTEEQDDIASIIERKVQEEVSKIKQRLEQELADKKRTEEKKEKAKPDVNDSSRSNSSGNKGDDDLDIDEEIRRILS
jgi:hypothetical protein